MLTRVVVVCAVLISLLFIPVFAQTAPSITSLSPSVGPVPPAGGPVTIKGTNFGTQPGTVTFGGTTVTATSWNDTSIVVTLPSTLPVGSLNVVVTVNGVSSNAQSFLLIPTITSDSPGQATVGTPITITGTSFGDQQGSSTVTFNGIAASPSSWSNRSIAAPVPVGASDGTLVVTVNGFQTNGLTFDIVPNILSLTPGSGPVGAAVTIGGNGFGTSQGFGGVTFNGTSATVTNWSDTSISVTVPQGAATGNVVVTASSLLTSAGVPFTLPPTLVSLALSPSNPSLALNSVQQLKLTATGTFSDNSTQDLTASVTWSSSNTSVAMVMPIVGVVGIVGVNKVGTTTITAGIGNVSSNTLVTVTPAVQPPTPVITGVSTGSGAAGTSVTITGSNFGTQQGNGSVLLGTALGAVTNWGDSQVQATVVAGSTSGVVRIQQNGNWSNSMPFSVSAPAITGVTPPSGLSGTLVTITGSGFGGTQGSGQVLLGSAQGVVTSWSDGQVQANVAPGSTSGVVQIIQNGVLSNAVPFTVNIPQITGVTPSSGASGTSVTVSGSGFGTSQGTDGIVWIGSVPGNVVSWSDGTVQATVASNSVSGIVRIHQNGVWSNAFSFAVPPAGTATPVSIVPNLISMLVGETRSLQALDSTGKPITGLTWTSSDTTLATLSTDDPPIITAIAPSHVTITGGNASADLTIYAGPSLPAGTVQWSNPGNGSAVANVLPAVPSDSGVDVFATRGNLQSGMTVQAVKADGTTAWTTQIASPADGLILPDFQGGFVTKVVTLPNGSPRLSVQEFDRLTGQPNPAYSYSATQGATPVLVHPDGTIFTADGDSIVGIDPATGQAKFKVQLDDGVTSANGNCGEFTRSEDAVLPTLGNPIIAGDGFAYFPYTYSESPLASNDKICYSPPTPICELITRHEDFHLRLARVGTDGSLLKLNLGDWSSNSSDEIFLGTTGGECGGLNNDISSASGAVPSSNVLGTLITNADQGLFYSWDLAFGNGPSAHQLSTITSSGGVSTVSMALPGTFQPTLQGEGGTLFGIVSDPQGSFPNFMIALDSSGSPKWSAAGYSPQKATDDGGVIAQSPAGASVTLDSTGNVTGHSADSGALLSWSGELYTDSASNIVSYGIAVENLAGSFWPFADGNASKTKAARSCVLTVSPDSTLILVEEEKSNINRAFAGTNVGIKYVTGSADLQVTNSIDLPSSFLGVDNNLSNLATISFSNIFNAKPSGAVLVQVQVAAGVIIAHEFGHYLLQCMHTPPVPPPGIADCGIIGIMKPGTMHGSELWHLDFGIGNFFTDVQKAVIRKKCRQLHPPK